MGRAAPTPLSFALPHVCRWRRWLSLCVLETLFALGPVEQLFDRLSAHDVFERRAQVLRRHDGAAGVVGMLDARGAEQLDVPLHDLGKQICGTRGRPREAGRGEQREHGERHVRRRVGGRRGRLLARDHGCCSEARL